MFCVSPYTVRLDQDENAKLARLSIQYLPPLLYSRNRHHPPLEAPVITAVSVVRIGYRNRLIRCSNDFLRKGGENLVPLGCVKGGNSCRVLECRLELAYGRARADKGGQHALRRSRRLAEDGGTHERGHCYDCAGAMEEK